MVQAAGLTISACTAARHQFIEDNALDVKNLDI
jgi:hypothetical protein